MKATTPILNLAAIGACVALAGCGEKWEPTRPAEPTSEVSPAPAPAAPPAVVLQPAPPAPAPAAAPGTVPLPPAPRAARIVAAEPIPLATRARFAPPGVFYLLHKVSITTKDGVFGLPAGSRVELVSRGVYGDAEGHRVKLGEDQVTNDVQLAELIARNDAAAQAALHEAGQLQAARYEPPPIASTVRPTMAPLDGLTAGSGDAPADTSPLAPTATPTVAPTATPTDVPAPGALPGASSLKSGPIGEVHSRTSDRGYYDSRGLWWYRDVFGRWHVRP